MDFSLKLLNTRIWCTAPSADEYSLENLISAEAAARSKGFLTEGFVRPPVNVDFTFSAPIDIFHIFFDTKVLSKQCCAFAVFLSCHPSDESSFVRVGIYNTKNEDHVHLIGASLDKWYQYPVEKKNLRNSSSGSVFEGRLRSSIRDALKNVQCLRIRLLRNVSTGGSGLKNIEVWGKVGDLAAPEDKNVLLKSWQKYLHSLHRKQQPNLHKCLPPEVTVSQPPDDGDEDIPEDFLDPITCDLMVTPMLLPSGHSVDITTLDKFNAAEMRYNRPPSNPFTGIAFTADRKPVPNTGLKSRIDRFVLLRQHDGNVEDRRGTWPWFGKSVSGHVKASSSSSKPSVSLTKESNASNASSLADENKKLNLSDKSCDKPTFRGFSIINTASSSSCSSSTDAVESFRGHRGLPQHISARPSRAAISERRLVQPKPGAKTSVRSNSLNVPISRDLVHSKPSRLIQGDGIRPEFHAYNSGNLLPSPDECCKCKCRDQLYSVSPCQHLVCRRCLCHQAPSAIACPRCSVVVDSTRISKHHS